jgi:hypothetical protein
MGKLGNFDLDLSSIANHEVSDSYNTPRTIGVSLGDVIGVEVLPKESYGISDAMKMVDGFKTLGRSGDDVTLSYDVQKLVTEINNLTKNY